MRPTHVSHSAGENRLRYFQLLMNGSYTPKTLPVGGEEAREVSPRSLAEALLVRKRTSSNIMSNNSLAWLLLYVKSLP